MIFVQNKCTIMFYLFFHIFVPSVKKGVQGYFVDTGIADGLNSKNIRRIYDDHAIQPFHV